MSAVAVVAFAGGLVARGSAQDVASGSPTLEPAGSSRSTLSASTPTVELSLRKSHVTTQQHAKVIVDVTLPQSDQGVDSGEVKIVARAPGAVASLRAPVRDGRATASLPRLAIGDYRVRAKFLGTDELDAAVSEAETLLVRLPVEVGLSLDRTQLAPGQRAVAKVRVRAGTRPVYGKVKVAVAGAGRAWSVTGQVSAGRATLKLPALSQVASYRARATFTGTQRLSTAKSGFVGLTVSDGTGGSCALPAFPDETCTGVPVGTSLSAYTGPSNITAANTVISGKTLGCIQVSAPGVVIRNSKISCSGSAVYISDGDIVGTPLLLEDVEIDCKDGSGTAVGEASVTVRRANIHGCENGFDMNQDITVEDSYIHDLWETGDSHTDGIQMAYGHFVNGQVVRGALNITIRHNTIYGVGADGSLGTSAIITNGVGDTNILIQDNLLAGGAYTLYCNRPGAGTNFRVIGNHFSRKFSSKVGAFGPSDGCSDEVQSGNVYHETGKPLKLP